MTARLFAATRAIAILIAVAAVIDPGITSVRRERPEVALVAATAGDSALARRVTDRLGDRYRVVAGPYAGAAATVIVGSQLPGDASTLAAPVYAVLSDHETVSITGIGAPATAALDATLTIEARVHSTSDAPVTVALRAGDVVVDRVTMNADDGATARLGWTPTAAGLHRVTVAIEGGATSPRAATVVSVVDARARILVIDPRPSWMSTFVRRAIEADPRFVVESRINLSRGIAAEAGQPAGSLNDVAALAAYDLVVVGAADALTAGDVRGLERHLRARGATALLLLDQAPGLALGALAGTDRWTTVAGAEAAPMFDPAGDTLAILSAEVAWPVRQPAAARAVAVARVGNTARPIIWSVPVGAGQLTVSGALDAWRFRDVDGGFAHFWQRVAGDAAERSLHPLDAALDASLVAPGEATTVTVLVRDVLLGGRAGAPIEATAEVGRGDERAPVRLWPDPLTPGRFTGTFRAPNVAGDYRVVITAGGARAELPLSVDSLPARAHRDDRDLLAAHAHAHDGIAVAAGDLDQLLAAFDEGVVAPPRSERWHPMRSPWWLLPFVLLLSAEWWWRRRHGAR